MDTNPTETRIASVYIDEKEIIIITMKDCGLVDEFDVMDLNLVIRHKAGNEARLKLFVSLASYDLTKKAKEMAHLDLLMALGQK